MFEAPKELNNDPQLGLSVLLAPDDLCSCQIHCLTVFSTPQHSPFRLFEFRVS